MRDLRRCEKHGRSVWTSRGACPASDASRRFHRKVRLMLGNRDRVCLWRRACARGNKSTSLHNAIQRPAIDYQIFHKRERSYAKRLDGDRRAVAKLSHVKLAHRARMIGTVWFAVNGERASAANTFAAIRVERDWFVSTSHQSLIENVQHFYQRRVRRNVARFIINEFAWRLSVLLSPDLEFEVHGKKNCRATGSVPVARLAGAASALQSCLLFTYSSSVPNARF